MTTRKFTSYLTMTVLLVAAFMVMEPLAANATVPGDDGWRALNSITRSFWAYPEGASYQFANLAYINFPQGAVSEPIEFTVVATRYLIDVKEYALVFDFSPDYEFGVPITLGLSNRILGYKPGDEVIFLYYDDETDEWIELYQGIYDGKTHWVIFEIDHFSTYAFIKPKLTP